MRVIHLVASSDRRGAEVFATELVKHLGGAPDHEVLAIRAGTAERRLDVRALGSSRTDPRGFAHLVSRLRRADVLVAHGSSSLLHGAAAGSIASRPFVYRNIGDPAAWGDVRGAAFRIGTPLRHAARVAALYPSARDHLISSYRLDRTRVATIPNAVPEFPRPDHNGRAVARQQFSLDPSRRWVGFVGALSEEKGVLDAIAAVAIDPGLGLLVAGGGPQADQARECADRTAPGRVRFLGVTDEPLSVLAAVDVLVIPSRTEGMPGAAIEAGLSGVPVVATDVGGVSEVVVDGATGVLVDSVEPVALVSALRRAIAQREAFGDAARERCQSRFTMDPVARQWASLLDEVSASARRR
ncbi:glycosyltransferase family 4 protein [soil metagenome]